MSSNQEEQESKKPGLGELQQKENLRRRKLLALGLLAVSVLFCGIVAGVMVTVSLNDPAPPLEVEHLENLRALLKENPENEKLKTTIRRLDSQIRTEYLTRQYLLYGGAFLLLIGGAAIVACGAWYASMEPQVFLPLSPAERSDEEGRQRMKKRRLIAVGTVGGLIVVALLAGAFFGGVELPEPEKEASEGKVADAEKEKQPEEEPPTPEELAQNWHRFRGPRGMGTVPEDDWPQSWNGAEEKNIIWKTEVPVKGQNSPIVWDNRLFITGGDAEKREVMCFDTKNGELQWRTEIEAQSDMDPKEVEPMEDTGYCAPTVTTDGHRVYAFFATADLAAVDFEGNVEWAKFVGEPNNTYGIATSPVYHRGKLFLQFDRGTLPDEGESALLAFDPRTGDEEWKKDRKVANSWTTPVLGEAESGLQLITSSNPWVVSYDPSSGSERWRAKLLSGDVAPSPVFADGMAYVTNQYATVAGIEVDGRGDVTESKVAWTGSMGMSDASSPVCNGEFFLQANSMGLVTCYDAKDGELVWDHQFETAFWASPTLVGDTVYLPGEKGTMYFFDLADSFELKGKADLGEPSNASPAFKDGRIYVRGRKHLFCIGKESDGDNE